MKIVEALQAQPYEYLWDNEEGIIWEKDCAIDETRSNECHEDHEHYDADRTNGYYIGDNGNIDHNENDGINNPIYIPWVGIPDCEVVPVVSLDDLETYILAYEKGSHSYEDDETHVPGIPMQLYDLIYWLTYNKTLLVLHGSGPNRGVYVSQSLRIRYNRNYAPILTWGLSDECDLCNPTVSTYTLQEECD